MFFLLTINCNIYIYNIYDNIYIYIFFIIYIYIHNFIHFLYEGMIIALPLNPSRLTNEVSVEPNVVQS